MMLFFSGRRCIQRVSTSYVCNLEKYMMCYNNLLLFHFLLILFYFYFYFIKVRYNQTSSGSKLSLEEAQKKYRTSASDILAAIPHDGEVSDAQQNELGKFLIDFFIFFFINFIHMILISSFSFVFFF